LMLAIDMDSADTAKSVVNQLLAKGILINRTHDTVLRFLPPYITEKKHVDQVIGALDSALAASNSSHEGSRIRSIKPAAA
jgi:acetylornithine/N-succinyldiaminopimelate aminotransferase